MIRLLFLLILVSGCGTLGSNIKESRSTNTHGKEKVDASFSESRQTEAPQPSNINVEASGNANVTVNPQTDTPKKKDDLSISRGLKSSEWVDQSFKSLFKQHSSMFYLMAAISFIIFVIGIFLMGKTFLGRGLSRGISIGFDALESVLEGVGDSLTSMKPESSEHNELIKIQSCLEKKLRKLKYKN